MTASSLNRPFAVAVDSGGNLYVADQANHRVLEYDAPFSGCASFPCVATGASHVFGQGGSFTSQSARMGGVSADSLYYPYGVAADAQGDLYVADSYDNRGIEYNAPLTTGGGTPGMPGASGDTTADVVFGQNGSFTSATPNNGGVSADSFYLPYGVAVDTSGNLYVSDLMNNRVLEYNSPLATGGGTPGIPGAAGDTTADLAFGQQGNFTTSTANNGGLGPDSLDYPYNVALDANGDLYVADETNSRILEYNSPLAPGGGTPGTPGAAGDTTADVVFGQNGSFTSAAPDKNGISADSLYFQKGWRWTIAVISTSRIRPTIGCWNTTIH